MRVDFAEGRVTRLRREVKVIIRPDELPGLSRQLEAELEGACPPSTQITSVYFDRPGLPLWLRTIETPSDCLKIRTKEYFPDLSGAANRVVLEAKRELNGLTRKRRVWLQRARLGKVIEGGGMGVARMITGGRLLPVLAVTYVRQVYQPTGDWRVTVDRELHFYRVTPRLALAPERLDPARLGPPAASEDRVVVELKFMGASLPGWLVGLAERKCERFSKFGEGMARLHSARSEVTQGG